jgi:hypothetical protein
MKAFSTTRSAGAIAAGALSQQSAPRTSKRDLLLLQKPKTAADTLFFDFSSPTATDGSCLSLRVGSARLRQHVGPALHCLLQDAQLAQHPFSFAPLLQLIVGTQRVLP